MMDLTSWDLRVFLVAAKKSFLLLGAMAAGRGAQIKENKCWVELGSSER